jgi:hypothetical protein
MSNTTVVIVNTNNHTNATEFVIILSQSVFFVLLFLLMKKALIDSRGMMYDYNRIQEEKLQLGAIFFAIFVFIALLMVPLESYEFVHFVVPLTYIIIICIIVWEISIKKSTKQTLPGPSSFKPTVQPVVTAKSRVTSATFDY